MSKCTPLLILIATVFLVISCDGIKNAAGSLFDNSDRAKYERQFKGSDSLLQAWNKSYAAAVSNQLTIKDAYSMSLAFAENDLYAVSYLIDLEQGDLLIMEADRLTPPSGRFFADLFTATAQPDPYTNVLFTERRFSRVSERDGTYRIMVQPEIGFVGTLNLKIYTRPSYEFPVLGKGNTAAQSFWGATRDGGARNHEGVDLFASRGTPVVAVTNGLITRTGNSGLGGKQVWQRDAILNQSLYYAHLDSVMVESGQQIKVGDTLGTVGSTGNAQGGVPHLHFGIYASGGAVNPWPFLRKRPVPKDHDATGLDFKYLKPGSNLRKGPGINFDISETIKERTDIKILAGDSDWFHIKTRSGKEGFVNRNRLQ